MRIIVTVLLLFICSNALAKDVYYCSYTPEPSDRLKYKANSVVKFTFDFSNNTVEMRYPKIFLQPKITDIQKNGFSYNFTNKDTALITKFEFFPFTGNLNTWQTAIVTGNTVESSCVCLQDD